MPLRKMSMVLLASFLTGSVAAQVTWFEDAFDRKEPGPAWMPATGDWEIRAGALRLETKSYDQMTVCSTYVFGTTQWTIEVSFRGVRAGLFFNIDDPATKRLSHMVRFEEKSILAGYFTGGGEFVATSSFEVAEAPAGWTRLHVTIDPPAGRYSIAVNSQQVGIDTNLRFPSGYFGLQGSEGVSEFRSVNVSGATPQSPPALLSAGDVPALRHISSATRAEEGVTVYDPERDALLHLDRRGRLLRQTRETTHPSLPQDAMVNGRRYSIEGRRIVLRDGAGATVDSIVERLVAPAAILATPDGRLLVSDPGAGGILAYDERGRFMTLFTARTLGGFTAPRSIDFLNIDTLIVADYSRVILIPASLEEIPPLVAFPSPAQAVIQWTSAEESPGQVRYSPDGGPWTELRGEGPGKNGRYTAHLTGLTPLTRYSFTISPTLVTIPPAAKPSVEFRFATPPPRQDQRSLTRLPILCMVYRTITYRDTYPASRFPFIPDGRRISDDELAYLRQACKFNTEFYYRNSGCSVVLDIDFHVVEDTLRLGDVGPRDPYWLSVTDRVTRDFEHAAAVCGKNPAEYNGLVVPYAWVNHPPRRTSALRDPSKTDSITIRQMYGGGTYGVPAPWKYGATSGYTGNPFQDRFSRQDWLITHEFHHQIDALMEASGYPEYYHADQPWKMPGSFGEDFDFNALIIRKAGREPWLTLRFGSLTAVTDADHDGLPDDDPSLPFDEKRLGSSSTRVDSDGDGLADLAEVMAGSERGSDVLNTDTDRDGIRDNNDEAPLYPIASTLRKISPPGHSIRSVTDRVFLKLDSVTALFLCYDDSALYTGYRYVSPAPADSHDLGFLFQIDGNADGWFHGFDNTQIRIRWTGDSVRIVDYYLRDCASWTEVPRDRKDILKSTDLQIDRSVLKRGNGTPEFILVARIPFNVLYGPAPRPGGRMAVRFGFQTVEDRWVWREAFDRNAMVTVRWDGLAR